MYEIHIHGILINYNLHRYKTNNSRKVTRHVDATWVKQIKEGQRELSVVENVLRRWFIYLFIWLGNAGMVKSIWYQQVLWIHINLAILRSNERHFSPHLSFKRTYFSLTMYIRIATTFVFPNNENDLIASYQ